jgi:tyrosine-specific transport protein
LLLLAVFLIILGVFFVKSFPYINIDYLKTTDLRFFVMPYGVILFSLWGSSVIPEVKNVVKGNAKILKSVIIAGTFLAALVYLLFIFMIFGVTGPETSKEAILGMTNVLGSEVVKFGFIFGIITCFTSFITLGLTLKNILFCDFGMKKNLSWLIACLTPLLLFFLGAREFINIIGLTGTFTVGIMGIIIVFLYKEFLKKKLNKKINPLAYLLPAAFIIGVALEIFSFFTENIS